MFIETKVYRRLFVLYSMIIVVSISGLSIFFINKTTTDIKEQQQYISRKMLDDSNTYINNQIENTKTQMNLLYSDDQELDDILFYLNNDFDAYVKNKLDRFSKSDKLTYRGVDSFIRGCYANNRNINNIAVASIKKNRVNIYDVKGYINSYDVKNYNSDATQWEEIENSAIKMIKVKNDSTDSCFYSTNYVIDPYNLQKVGIIVVSYKMSELDEVNEKYNLEQSQLMVTNNKGEVVYDSLKKYTGMVYPYFEKIRSDSTSIYLDKPSYVNFKPNASGLIIMSIIPESTVLNKSQILIRTVIGIVIFLIIIGEAIVYLKIKRLERRTLNIIKAIDSVKQGNFKIKISMEKDDDEINLIAQSFNDMCGTLEEYINKVYVSEIKQKNAEMLVLQNQINPHFLYNTLESIRMKAIINGDKEVGKMLYNLATLFRSIVKAQNIISIRQEVDYCKMYLDLYKFRYEDRFEYCIDFDDEIVNKQIIKFTLQPIVENFLVHGIDLNSNENLLIIYGEKIDGNIVISIEDNGNGMEDDEIVKLNEAIKSCSDTKKSIGLTNVHERIALLYGEQYGLKVMKVENKGTKVIITIPDREVE